MICMFDCLPFHSVPAFWLAFLSHHPTINSIILHVYIHSNIYLLIYLFIFFSYPHIYMDMAWCKVWVFLYTKGISTALPVLAMALQRLWSLYSVLFHSSFFLFRFRFRFVALEHSIWMIFCGCAVHFLCAQILACKRESL